MGYKALQNKAFHKGAYIAHVQMNDEIYTTNAGIMVLGDIREELKAVKGQIDNRENDPIDGQFIADALTLTSKVIDTAREFTTETGLEVIELLADDGAKVIVQGVYLDYIVARFGLLDWYVTDSAAVGTKDNKVIALIAKVNE